MTEEQFAKYSYRHSDILIYHCTRPKVDIECMLIGIDFANRLFHLWPIDQGLYEYKTYWVPCEKVDKKIVITMKLKEGDKKL